MIRLSFSLLAVLSVVFGSLPKTFAYQNIYAPPKAGTFAAPVIFRLKEEPLIRIGLATNARSATISTGDAQLVSVSPDEQPKFLATASVTVAARAYRPPEIEIYNFEIPGVQTREEAETLAKEAREATGEPAAFSLDAKTNRWRVRIGEKKETIEEANEYKEFLAEKGFGAAEIVSERVKQISDEAVALSRQLKTGGKSEVRSLIKPIVSSAPATDAASPASMSENLREVIVSGASPAAKFSSLKSVAFGSVNERIVPVRVNGKAYRGRIEVFVNARGALTIVNVVALEDYLRGVVPNELSLPALEAQKAQAIAARTYAVANINQFAAQGFDLLPTTRSQVYSGFASENATATRAVEETRGIVATYKGKPINALYTSTCGGRTENSENIFEFKEPYLRGVECSLEGERHFEPFLVKTLREPAKTKREENYELVRRMSLLAVSGFQLSTNQFTDDWFENAPNQSEMSNWLNQIAARLGKTFPNVNQNTAKPAEFARLLAHMIYGEGYADTLLSEADKNYWLSFSDASDVPPIARPDVAILLRDGYLNLYPDASLKPNQSMPRRRWIRMISQIYDKRKWLPALQTGTTRESLNGKLTLRVGKTDRQLNVRPDVFLFRAFGEQMFQVKEAALVGGETVNFRTNSLGEVDYLEIRPVTGTTTAERFSPRSNWNENLSPSAVQARLARYVRGMRGSLVDVRIAKQGFSRRATELEILTTAGTYKLAGGKIRSALRLYEQLFVIDKRYDSTGRALAYNFTGRGWGHGIGMCQYGAYGFARMGLKHDAILKHYYTGIDLTKAY